MERPERIKKLSKNPKRGEPGYEKYREKYNARRRRRRADPEYRERERLKFAEQRRRRKERQGEEA
ncbi:hypothetical protein ACWDTP_20865 [Mycobacterium sp. NPDC003449]